MSDSNTVITGARTKYERISALSEKHTLEITRTPENWRNFLASATAVYKYQWADQVLIHAQRPDTSACASMQMWNETFGRWVTRGSKGIALIDRSGPTSQLKYVFDIRQTRESQAATRRPYIWRMGEEHEQSVLETLKDNYGNHGETVKEQIKCVIEATAKGSIS